MNKDALLATAIGFFIGLSITGLLLVGPSLMNKLPKVSFQMPSFPKSQPKSEKKSEITKETAQSLTIDSPLHESIESEKELLISGKAQKGSTIVIQGVVNDTAVSVKDDGAFAGKITLIEGKNDITISSHLDDTSSTRSITVFYTPEAL